MAPRTAIMLHGVLLLAGMNGCGELPFPPVEAEPVSMGEQPQRDGAIAVSGSLHSVHRPPRPECGITRWPPNDTTIVRTVWLQGAIVLRDTVADMAFDSVVHRLDGSTMDRTRFHKHFAVVGPDTLYIARTWTNDPHFICDFPKGPLYPGVLQSMEICLVRRSASQGPFTCPMGLVLSDGRTVDLTVRGMASD